MGLIISKLQVGGGEFRGLDFKQQMRRLTKGKALLDSVFAAPVTTFIPPFNAYDSTTLHALQEIGFTVISADMYGCMPKDTPLGFLPETLGPRFRHFAHVFPALEDHRGRSGVMVVMMHPYDLTQDYPIDSLRLHVQKLKSMPWLRCHTFQQLNAQYSVNEVRVKANRERNLLTKLLKTEGMLHPAAYVYTLRVINVLLHIVFAVIGFIGSRRLIRKKRGTATKAEWMVAVLVATLVATGTWYHWLTPLKWLALCFASGTVAGLAMIARRAGMATN